MPEFPCWADLAARDYAADPEEARVEAIFNLADEIDTDWPINALRSRLKPHENEALDEIINEVASRILTERADDNFIEPEAW